MFVNKVSLGVLPQKNYSHTAAVKRDFSPAYDTVSFSGVKILRDEKGRVVKEIGDHYTLENRYKGRHLASRTVKRGNSSKTTYYGKFEQKLEEITEENGKVVEAMEYFYNRSGEYKGYSRKYKFEGDEITEKYACDLDKQIFAIYVNGRLKTQTLRDSYNTRTTAFNKNGDKHYEKQTYGNDKIIEKKYSDGELAEIIETAVTYDSDETGRQFKLETIRNINPNNPLDIETKVRKTDITSIRPAQEDELSEFQRSYY